MREVLKEQRNSASHLFLVHGELDRQEKFMDFLGDAVFKGVHIPDLAEEVVL